MEPKIYYNNVKFRLGKTKGIKDWIKKVIRSEGKQPGDLSFIFSGKEEMLEMNIEFLGHDYHTDVITFDYSNNSIAEGEIYLGIDTIRVNAKRYGIGIREEVMRVMVHGVLHILGYDDGDEKAVIEMRAKEDEYIDLAGRAYGRI